MVDRATSHLLSGQNGALPGDAARERALPADTPWCDALFTFKGGRCNR